MECSGNRIGEDYVVFFVCRRRTQGGFDDG